MVHRFLDDTVFAKAAAASSKYIPSPIRTAIRNIIANLTEPGVAANDLLQGHPEISARTVGRFAANTTVGLGGMIDVAAHLGLPHHDNGFADTFGRWGVYPGPYLFIPLMGPTTVRDGLGSVADTLTDPFTWSRFYHRWTIIDVRAVWSGLDQRTEADLADPRHRQHVDRQLRQHALALSAEPRRGDRHPAGRFAGHPDPAGPARFRGSGDRLPARRRAPGRSAGSGRCGRGARIARPSARAGAGRQAGLARPRQPGQRRAGHQPGRPSAAADRPGDGGRREL